jgi:hypothetical protein
LYKQIRTIYTWNWTCQVHAIIHSFSSKKLAPCKIFSWLLNWHLAIFLAPTFWEPEQPLQLNVNFTLKKLLPVLAERLDKLMGIKRTLLYEILVVTLIYSEWVIVVKHQHSNFSAFSWWEQVNLQWDDDEVHFVLDQHT